jgi:chemotaxis regulatin CheY-phosphate phosphatase CheZ
MKDNPNKNLDSLPDSQPTLKPFGDLEKLLPELEDWLDQQVLPLEIAEHANRILRYLRMAEEKSLPACLRAALAEHVAAVSSGRL